MNIPNSGFARIKHIVGDPNATPPIPPVIPVSRSGWWQGVKEGRYPAAVKLGPRVTAWRWSDISDLVDRLSSK